MVVAAGLDKKGPQAEQARLQRGICVYCFICCATNGRMVNKKQGPTVVAEATTYRHPLTAIVS